MTGQADQTDINVRQDGQGRPDRRNRSGNTMLELAKRTYRQAWLFQVAVDLGVLNLVLLKIKYEFRSRYWVRGS